jgi:hypothetical protein
VSLEQRVRAYQRSARDSLYRYPEIHRLGNVTNWRMLIARQFKIPVAEVRRILGEGSKHEGP